MTRTLASCHGHVTCVIPTHNRPPFLRRLLHYYGQFPPGYPLLVVDSSGPAAAAENLSAIEHASPGLQVAYRHADLNFIDKCALGLEHVQTPFAAFCADDDLLFPNTVKRCAAFLEGEPGYSSALGRTAQVRPKLPSWCCQVLKGYSIEHELPFDRCRQLAANWFTNFYAVYPTKTLLDMFQITSANTNSALGYYIPEMLLSQLSVLRGRIKVFPAMYSLLERHDTNAGCAMRSGVRPQAERLYQQFKECLTDQFVEAGVNREEAERFIEDTYDYFREPDWTIRRRPRSTANVIHKAIHKLHRIGGKAAGWLSTDHNRHRRFVRARDLVGCETMWYTAVQLIQDFPLGMPSESSQVNRCA